MEPGQVFAERFRIEKGIGEGGVGQVFRAHDTRMNQLVAVKCLRPEYARDNRIRRRFMREARAIGRLNHPNIVKMFGYGEDDTGVPYLAMELIAGTPMSEMRDEVLTVEYILELVDQVLAALAYVHARGIVHRDVKPENVLVIRGPEGTPPVTKLLDFGFARVEDDTDIKLTQMTGDAFGTPQYMAPEQASGKGAIGPPTDVYAMGVVLYEFLAGEPPFTGAHGMAVALKHLMEEVPPLKPRPELIVPPGLAGVVDKALRKEPHERYATAAEMRRAIAPFFSGGLSAAPAEPAPVAESAARIAMVAGGLRPAPDLSPETQPHEFGTGGFAVFTLAGEEEPAVAEADAQPLVGREEALTWLWQRVYDVCENDAGHVVLLGAGAGLGKSRVVAWLRDSVAEGGWMLSIGGVHGPGGPGTTGLRGALDDLFGRLPDDRAMAEQQVREIVVRWGTTGGRAADTLDAVGVSALVSYVRPLRGSHVASSRGGVEARGDVLYARICDALRLAARERPILVTLESIQRAGPETAGFLAHLAESVRRDPFPVLVLATHASDADGEPVASIRAALDHVSAVGGDAVERFELGPLPAEAVIELLGGLMPIEDRVAAGIARRSGGNPLYARELALYLRQTGELTERDGVFGLSRDAQPVHWPSRLSTTMLQRARATLAELPDPEFAGRAFEHAVVLGEAFEYEVLVDYLVRSLVDQRRVEGAVEALVKSQLLVESRDLNVDRLSVSHPVLHAIVMEQAREREDIAALHRHAAEAMVAAQPGALAGLAEDVGRHFELGSDPAAAARHYALAATTARDDGQLGHAFDLLEKADGLLASVPGGQAERDRAVLWLDLAELELRRAGYPRAQSLAVRVHGWARKNEHAAVEGRALLLLSDLLRRQGKLADASRGYGQAREAFQRAADPRGVARCLLGEAMVARGLGRQDEAATLFERTRQAMHAVRDTLGAARASQGIGELALRRGDYQNARAALALARRGFVEASDRVGATFSDFLLGETHRVLHAPDLAMTHFETARRGYASLGDHSGVARCHTSLARLYADRGSFTDASTHFQHAVAAYAETGEAARAAAAREELGLLALGQRSFAVAGQNLHGALEHAIAAEDAQREVVLRACLAWVAAEQGDTAACEREMSVALEQDKSLRVVDADFARALEGLAEVDAYLGNTQRARALLQRAIEVHQGLGGQADAVRLQHAVHSLGPGSRP